MVNIGLKSLILLIFLSSFLWAVQSPEFISYASGVIFEDCRGNDIHLSDNLSRSDNTSVDMVPWPYDQNTVAAIFSAFSSAEPFAECVKNKCLSVGVDENPIGIGFLKCGNNTLDASKSDYFWNGQKIESPRTQLINCTFNLNQTQINYAKFKDEANLTTLVLGVFISLISSAIFYLLLYPKSDKNRTRNCFILLVFCLVLTLIFYLLQPFVLK